MKKVFLFATGLLVSSSVYAQGAMGTIPVNDYNSSKIVTHSYKQTSTYSVANWDKKEVNISVEIKEDDKVICTLKKPPALLVLDGAAKEFTCGDKKLTLSLYKGYFGATWVVVKLGSKGDDNNLLDTESKLTGLNWPSAKENTKATVWPESRHKD